MNVLDQDCSANGESTERRRQRDEFIKKIEGDRISYVRSRNQLRYLWIILTTLSLSLGFITSILIAMGWPSATEQPGKSILVALPTIASFCGTILAHFRLRENWEMHELGRIGVEEIIIDTSHLPVDNPKTFSRELYELQMARVRLSRLQTAKFFATLTEKQASHRTDGDLQKP